MHSEKPFHHRPTLKQVNKPFKSKHKTKGSLKDQEKGKINRKSIKKSTSKPNFISKADRHNAAKLEQQKKRAEVIKTNRFFEGRHGAPKIVAIVPLCSDVDSCSAMKSICSSIEQPIPSMTKGISLLKSIQSQGFPSLITMAMHMEQSSQKKRNDIKKSLLSFINYFFPEEKKINAADQTQDVLNILRTICTQGPKQISWRESRPYMLSEELGFDMNDDKNTGTLKVTGYVRGLAFSANRLVHLQNFGDFQLNKITSCPKKYDNSDNSKEMEEDIQVLEDSLEAENEPNLMENEQTWPTEEEMAGYEDIPDAPLGTTPNKIVKRVPKGTSTYQAAWIVDSESNSEYSYYSDDEDGDVNMNYENNEEQNESIHLDPEEESKQLKEYLANREKEQRDDIEFPDEVDTPSDIATRIRFQKYRGLQSFRTSPWDPYENLPIDYARIYQFENYKGTKNRVISQASTGGSKVKVGSRITLHIANVPKKAIDSYDSSRPFTVFGLFEHEHKMSVLNFVVTRRYEVRPQYSQNTLGGKGTNNVHKFERFLISGRTCVATIYGPIQFGKVPVTLYKETETINNSVASGYFWNANPKRIIAKRIILTGHPFKIHKKSAVIRYMFFNPEDVLWFKPVQLTTKYGRVGHIRESLGTHGYMKCIFDSPINQQDTVMMNLYKRVFPKWNTTILWREKNKILNVTSKDEDNNIQDIEMAE
ncbi:5683_t:CDS:10 [Diversispora eburnea]|uniref:5683_t:CDS:1 n=1 Tax=Diversispora eburnea TaxID=1213867 RepID=A0A9N8UZ88_9GLOM|nr:5683_t:CDS:10 [Diversispora eburnea]